MRADRGVLDKEAERKLGVRPLLALTRARRSLKCFGVFNVGKGYSLVKIRTQIWGFITVS